jgi:hypothetical protein
MVVNSNFFDALGQFFRVLIFGLSEPKQDLTPFFLWLTLS